MSLGIALNNALSGLKVNQQSISVLSQNIANVNTSGYSRQIVNQSAVQVEGIGSGVKIDEISRKIDVYLQRSTQAQGSTNASSQTISDYYQRLQSLLGQPGANNSLDAFLTSFFNSVQQLAESPETTSLKGNAVSAGAALAKQISDLAANVYDLRAQADSEIAVEVDAVNAALDRLKSVNIALTQAKSLGQGTADLLDQRDKNLRELSGYLDISISYASAGEATITTGGGVVILEDGTRHQLRYNKAAGANTFISDQPLGKLEVLTVDDAGAEIGSRLPLITGGVSSSLQSRLTGGTIDGLQQMRDVKFNGILQQLDELAARLRDGVNAIHNSGSGFPPATVLTGDRFVHAQDQYSWSGQVRIAVLKSDGMPVPARYTDENYTGVRPLTLNLSRLDSGDGNGKPTLQTIVDEINYHFGAPGNKAELGNINNIKLASDTNVLPSGAPSLFNFDLDIENISETSGRVFVTGMTVLDDTATDITNITQTAPSISIAPTNSYITTNGSPDVTITLNSAPGLAVGDTFYLNAPSGAVNGILASELTGFFTVSAVNGKQITFTSNGTAGVGPAVDDAGNIQMLPPYHTIVAGQEERTRDEGQLQVNLSGSPGSQYYDITLNVSVVDADGTISNAPITYRVKNNDLSIFNKRYSASAVGGDGDLVLPSTSQESLRAILVDADGNELPKVNGKYVDGDAHLKIIGGNAGDSYSVAIDDMSSMQLGLPDGSPPEAGTNRGFSHYFGLNNFFASNDPIATGDTVHNSAINLRVEDRLISNVSLISVGQLAKQAKSVTSGGREVYTYARFSGDNSVAQRMASYATQTIGFDAAGGLPATQLSLQSYSSEILGHMSQRTAEATANAVNAKTLYEGFRDRSDAVSGVNLDEELANTILFQNAYAATARVMTSVNKMYDDLLQAF